MFDTYEEANYHFIPTKKVGFIGTALFAELSPEESFIRSEQHYEEMERRTPEYL